MSMKHYIFDMGGVILKPIPYDLIKDESSFVNCDTPELEDLFYKNFYKYEKGDINTKEFVYNLQPYFNKKDLTPEEYEESYLDIGKKYGGVFDNAYSEIKKLKEEGNRVYLLSNLHELAFKDFSSLFDTKIFDRLFLSFEIGMIKPNEDIFKYVIKEIDDEPKNMYFFDDKLENVNAAINTGMNAIVTTGSNLKNSIDSIKNRE